MLNFSVGTTRKNKRLFLWYFKDISCISLINTLNYRDLENFIDKCLIASKFVNFYELQELKNFFSHVKGASS